MYATVNEETKIVIKTLFELSENPEYKLMNMQKQVGSKDCGLFSIDVATALLFIKNVSNLSFCQQKMRYHLLSCWEVKLLSSFPSS